MKKKVAIYTRVSTLDQAKVGYSLDAQENILRQYCILRDYEVYNLYTDAGISAKSADNRPALQQLLADADKNLFDIILVWKLTRFSRRLSDLATMCDSLDRKGIALVSYSEAFDCSTPAGKMIRNMLGTIAQFEREVISENVIAAMTERARQGKKTCSYVLGYDRLDKDNLVINEDEAEQVNFIFESYLRCKNFTAVANMCRERNYKGKMGKFPRPESIKRILTRPIYCGYNSFKGLLYKGNHTPIINLEIYNQIQDILISQGKHTGRSNKYPMETLQQQ